MVYKVQFQDARKQALETLSTENSKAEEEENMNEQARITGPVCKVS